MLNYGRQSISQDDIDSVVEVLRSDLLTTGPAVERFEQAVCSLTGARYAVACSSGTAALHLITHAVGLGPGDQAIVPAVTFLATANAVRYVGADVIFADCDPETGLMRPQDLAAALARSKPGAVKAVFTVDYAGQIDYPAEIAALVESAGAIVIEDAAHALGSVFSEGAKQYQAGGHPFRHASMFSFHPVKCITTGEGGMVVTDSKETADVARRFRSHGMTRQPDAYVHPDMANALGGGVNPWYYEMQTLGFNYRLTDIQSALGISQLAKIDTFVSRRKELVARYDERFRDVDGNVKPLTRLPDQDPAWHIYVVLIDFHAFDLDRKTVMQMLGEQGIGTQVHYIPVHMQPYYVELYGRHKLAGAETFYERTLSLPLHPGMTDQDVDRVVDCLLSILTTGKVV